ncbi:hypothetical protein JKP88DRAFT_172344 [Tribonema minus]|uniref:Peptidase M20 dimerisation domain-containing protein n=1 Tax=Tribonema minus TaxID=303371 RepID=A0A836C872_9STRA|nr:hypothetical protein JKP88DRAFT_172344 [Tribonema minus]
MADNNSFSPCARLHLPHRSTPTLTARRPECTDLKGPRVLFNSHIDTVPPYIPARVETALDGDLVIWGRGACDTKGILAAQLTALQHLVDGGCSDAGLLYVVSEETDHSGMLASNDLGLDPDFLVVGEPTGSKMMRLQKGMLKMRLECKGVACHSGYPQLGKSAIDPLVAVLQRLNDTKWPASEELGATTLNIGLVNGGQAANALAEHAEATLMFRLTDEPEVVLAIVKSILEGTDVTMQIITQNSPVKLAVLPGFETDVAAYNTDIAYFNFTGKALLYGPGSIHHAHSRTEKILGSEITAAIDAYTKIAAIALGSATTVPVSM